MGNEYGRKRKGGRGKGSNGIKNGTTGFKQREEDKHGRIYVRDGKRIQLREKRDRCTKQIEKLLY